MTFNQEKRLFFLMKRLFINRKIRFSEEGIIIVESKLETLLILIEYLEEEEKIQVQDRLGTYYLRKGSILLKKVRLCLKGDRAYLVPPMES